MDKPWKNFERKIAAVYGTTRKLAKGTSEMSDIGGDQPDFPLVLDCKLRKRESWLICQWFKKIEENALKKNKWPVLAVGEPGKQKNYAFVRRAPLMKFVSERTNLNAEDFFSRMPSPGKLLPFDKEWEKMTKDFRKYKIHHQCNIPMLFMCNTKHDIEFAILRNEDLAMIFREGGLIK